MSLGLALTHGARMGHSLQVLHAATTLWAQHSQRKAPGSGKATAEVTSSETKDGKGGVVASTTYSWAHL